MQTAQNLGQIVVLGAASALFNAALGAEGSELPGYTAAFTLLCVPTGLEVLLAARARTASATLNV